MFLYVKKKHKFYLQNKSVCCLDCTLTVHRRCIPKVGNYCGCEENVLALYDKWKESVGLRKNCLDKNNEVLFFL